MASTAAEQVVAAPFTSRPVDSHSSCGVLVQAVNHATGQNTWRVMAADYDYNQEVARAAFADMLHDSERNALYRAGLQAAIRAKRQAGEEVHVLDIGTGTGLLAMMAASEGADSVTACEEFPPMAECASRVIADNGLTDKIKLVRKRSTDLTVGPGGDMERRANILVTEVFDTELIGEGALGTYNHAARELLTEDRLVVPGQARIWAQAVSSAKCADWAGPQPVLLGEGRGVLQPVPGVGGHSSLALHDLQLSALQSIPAIFTPLTAPAVVFEFDLACRTGPLPLCETKVLQLPAIAGGRCDAVFMWWDCWTDPAQSILLSCAPAWARHAPASPPPLPWRDHWMQAVYYPHSSCQVQPGQELCLTASHDEYSLWFDAAPAPPPGPAPLPALPRPQPGLHLAMSRTRLGQINNRERAGKLAGVVSRLVAKHRNASSEVGNTVLVLSEQSLLGLVAAGLGCSSVLQLCESRGHMREFLLATARQNKLQDNISLVDGEWLEEHREKLQHSLVAVIGEPHFSVSVLPWHNLLFWFLVHSLHLPPSVTISPHTATLYLIPVHFTHLWKIRAPLGRVEGFSMKHFDKIIERASEEADSTVEPHPLWEYETVALGPAVKVSTMDLTSPPPQPGSSVRPIQGEVLLSDSELPLNGVALWMDWQLDSETVVSGGPCTATLPGQPVVWDLDTKQGVHLISNPRLSRKLRYNIQFVPADGDFVFDFTAE